MAKGFSPLKTGSDPRSEAGTQNNWLKVEANQVVDVICLIGTEDMISCEQCAIWLKDGNNSPVWVYTGVDDPMHDLKLEKRYRAFIPVLTSDTKEVKVFSMSKSVHTAFLDLSDTVGDIKGLEVRIKRTGTGLQTRYQVISKGKRHKVDHIPEVDIPAMLGPLDSNGVKELIVEKLGLTSYDEVLEKYRSMKTGGSAPKAGGRKPARPKDVEEVEEFEEDAVAAEAEEESLDDLELA